MTCDEIYMVRGETLHTISDKYGDPFIVEWCFSSLSYQNYSFQESLKKGAITHLVAQWHYVSPLANIYNIYI